MKVDFLGLIYTVINYYIDWKESIVPVENKASAEKVSVNLFITYITVPQFS